MKEFLLSVDLHRPAPVPSISATGDGFKAVARRPISGQTAPLRWRLPLIVGALLLTAQWTSGASLAQQAYLKASNTDGYDSFGASVAASGDTMVVGAIGESSSATGVNGNQSDNSALASGAAYVFVRNGSSWSQQAFLKASNPDSEDRFGHAVAISGDTIVIGAPLEDSNAAGTNGNQGDNSAYDSGAVYVFVRTGTNWTQQAYLKASNTGGGTPFSHGDQFGAAVSISGDTIVVGAPVESSGAIGVNGNQNDNSAYDSGAVYVFVRTGTNWTQQAYLKPAAVGTDQVGDAFGTSVAISGDTVLVGAPYEDSGTTGVNSTPNEGALGSGAAYVFVRTGTDWMQQAYLKADNTNGHSFGSSVAASSNTVAIAAADVNFSTDSYVFVRNGTTWSQQARLESPIQNFGGGASVALSGDAAAVGGLAVECGSVFVFERTGAMWTQQAHLTAAAASCGNFGNSVAMSGGRIVVGAYNDPSSATGVNGNPCDTNAAYSGAAFIFDSTPVSTAPEITVQHPQGSSLTNGSSIVEFGSAPVSAGVAVQQSFLIRNIGSAALTWTGITMTGPGAADFIVNSVPPATLGICDSSAFTVTFSPGTLGLQTAVLHIASNDSDESPFDITLTGTGVVPVLDIAVEEPAGNNLTDDNSVVDFSSAVVGTPLRRVFVIRSIGNAPLTNVAVSIDGPHAGEYVITMPPANAISPGNSSSFEVTFTPAALGARTAQLHINSNDGDESPFDIALTGLGIPWLPITQEAYLKASNTGAGDYFGTAVAASGNTIVVGASWEDSSATGVNGNTGDNGATDSGALFVFVRDGANWTPQAYLKASNTGVEDVFGFAVAVSGNTLVVGAPYEDSAATGVNGNQGSNFASDSGAAYVYVRTGTNWTQQAYLKASNTGVDDSFGWSVAISGDSIIVGAPGEGAAYVFTRTGTNWTQQAYLKGSNPGIGDYFGRSVAVAGDSVVIGANGEDSSATGVNGNASDNSSPGAGAAYVFARSGSNWAQQAYLKASNTGDYDNFGFSVATSGDTIAVGARSESSNATGVNGNQSNDDALDSGAVYIFVRIGTNWTQQAYLKASNTGAGDAFGGVVSLSGGTLIVSAPFESSSATGVNGNAGDNGAPNSGAAYVFARRHDTWSQRAYLKPSNTDSGDIFGSAVAVSEGIVVIGAYGEASQATGVNGNQADNSAPQAGAAYVFSFVPSPTILAQPANQSVFIGSNATFAVLSDSTNPPLEYQWRLNGAHLPGATNASLTVSNAQIADLGDYQVVVSDTVSSLESAVARLSLIDALFLTSQPASRAVRAGSNVTFSVSAYGTEPLRYQWRFNGMALNNETNAVLSISNVQAAQVGNYTVVITNTYASVTSAVATLRLLIPPTVTQHLQPVTLVAGENATFTVTANSDAALPINYQWRKGSIPLTNMWLSATQCSFTMYNVQTNITSTNGPGSYRVVLTNAGTIGPGVISIATLTVLTATPPVVVTGPATNLSSNGATLFGSVNPLGSTTTLRFDYGLTTDYGASTPPVVIGNGTNSISVSNVLTGLSAGMTYHYRLVATNGGGVTTGMDRTFIAADSGPVLTLVSDGSGGYWLRFAGIPGLSYRSLRAPNVTGPWDIIDMQTAPASGLIEYHDATPLPVQGFYRVVQP